jgi:hypothetical protein
MRRNSQCYNVEGIPQNELTQLQHPWYLSDFIIYSPNMSTQFYVNKHCVPNMVKLVTLHGRSLSRPRVRHLAGTILTRVVE